MTNFKKIIAANWKMNGLKSDGERLIMSFLQKSNQIDFGVSEVVFFPSTPFLDAIHQLIEGSPFQMGGQDIAKTDFGAFTGDVHAEMLRDVGCEWVLVGHSERRQYHKETSADLQKKISQAHKAGLKIIYCIGETAEERKAEKTFEILEEQLNTLENQDLKNVIVAYEPVWAIGTGLTATFEDIKKTHDFLKKNIHKAWNKELPLLYGGSVKAKNAKEILSLPSVDGVLVGGASLDANEFFQIIKAAEK